MITGTEPAMPTLEQTGNTECWNTYYGLTIRQQFAAMAMQGLLSSGQYDDISLTTVSEMSVKFSDALIKELNKTES